MNGISRALPLSVVTALLACAHVPSHPLPEVQKAVDVGNARFAEAMKRGDAASMASVFTDDAMVVHPAAAGILRGRAAIEEFNRGRLAQSKFLDVVLTTVSLEVVGDLALEIGTNSLLMQTGEAQPVRRTGRYAVVWRLGPDGI